MLRTVRMLLLNPDLQLVYLVIGKGFRIRSQVSCQTALKLVEEEKIDLILYRTRRPFHSQPTKRTRRWSKPPDLLTVS